MLQEVESWMGHWLACAGMLNYDITINLGSTKVCLPAIFERYYSYDKDIWIAVNCYYIYFYLIVLFLYVAILHLINFKAFIISRHFVSFKCYFVH